MFEFLQGISPFWWFAFALLLGAIEMITPTTFLLWPAVSALVVGIALFLVPDLTGNLQVLSFAVLSIVLAIGGRWVFNRSRKEKGSGPALNAPAERVVGRRAEVLQANGTKVRVVVDGVRWDAKTDPGQSFKKGDLVIVTSAEGTTLHIAPLETD